jgi:Na+/H+-translocating membrane pyrophosphatase
MGFTGEVYPGLSAGFVAGTVDATINGSPGFRFSYSTPDEATARAAAEDIAAAWDVAQESNSYWGTGIITDAPPPPPPGPGS